MTLRRGGDIALLSLCKRNRGRRDGMEMEETRYAYTVLERKCLTDVIIGKEFVGMESDGMMPRTVCNGWIRYSLEVSKILNM
jgi:hypothetical protein